MPNEKREILHQIRNCLGPIQTFLQVVDTSGGDPKLKAIHEHCKESLAQIHALLMELDPSARNVE